MQEAAQALKNIDAPTYHDKDPFYLSISKLEAEKRNAEAGKIPLRIPLSRNDCKEMFDIPPPTWAKLNEFRLLRIDKDIEDRAVASKLIEVYDAYRMSLQWLTHRYSIRPSPKWICYKQKNNRLFQPYNH
jgi:hypothetical protein